VNRFFRPETAFFLAVWAGCLVGLRERAFLDPGSLWHVKVGELILADGLPRTDPFTYTFAGRPWVPQQWLAEVGMAAAHRLAGLDALLLGLATLVAVVFTAIFRRCVAAGMGPVLAGLVVGGGLAAGAFHYCARPHMATVALLAWTMLCVVDFDRGRCGPWRLAGLIPLFAVWTNLHGGVLAGILTLGLAVGGWLLKSQGVKSQVTSPDHTEGSSDLRLATCGPATPALLLGILAACALTPFVNPFGLELLHTWGRIVGSAVLPRVVDEHMPLDPRTPNGRAVLGYGLFYLVLLAGGLPARPRVTWLIPVVWLALSLKGIRNGPLFAVTAAVAVADLWPHTVWHRLLKRHGDGSLVRDPDPAPRPWLRPMLVPAAAVLAAFGLQLGRVNLPVVGAGWARLDPEVVPTDLTAGLTAYAAAVPPGTPVFNDANLGGYLIYHTPSLRIFMDDRCELYGDDWIRRYAEVLGSPPDEAGRAFEGWAAEYGFARAVVVTHRPDGRTPPLVRYLADHPDRWREIIRGRRAAVYERVGR
jgi:hypothetical protein